MKIEKNKMNKDKPKNVKWFTQSLLNNTADGGQVTNIIK